MTYADRNGNAFWKMGTRTTHADALHEAGRLAEAETLFSEAEQMQKELQPEYPLLYSLQGFRYCDLLLAAPARAALSAADAADNWDKNCKACHGAEGKGDTTMGKKLEIRDFTDAKFQATFTDEQATKAIKEGIKDGDKIKMKAYTDLTADEVKALVAKVRGLKK